MRLALFLCFFLGCCAAAFCQTGRLTGWVRDADTKTPLELATVSVYNTDSALLAYKLSDKNGGFGFEKLPLKKRLLLSVTYTGYVAHHGQLLLEGGKRDTMVVLLALHPKEDSAVVVSATVPVRMNGDTLEINPAAFKLKSGAVVEELLNQVSGITIWSDGTMTVNGVKVQNLLVDGKPFLGSTDTRVVTQNLPREAIDRIQLYQEYDRANIGRRNQPQDSLLTMNIKLKEASKKGYFGKAGAGYGTTDRYEADLSFQVYNKRSSAGIGGGINNINKNIGNLQEMFQNNTYRNYNPNLYNVGRFGANGINRNYSIGASVTHNFIETSNSRQNNRVTVNYNASGTATFITDLTLRNRTTAADPQFIREEGLVNSESNRHNLGVNYVKTNSYNDNLTLNGAAGTGSESSRSSRYTEVRDSAGGLLNTNTATNRRTSRSDNQSLNLGFDKRDEDEPLKNFGLQANTQRGKSAFENVVHSVFQSLTDGSKNVSFNRRYNTANQWVNVAATLDYRGFKRLLLGRYRLFGIDMGFTQSFSYNRAEEDAAVSDYDSAAKQYVINNRLSNLNDREVIGYTPAVSLWKGFSKWDNGGSRSFNLQARILNESKTERNVSSIAKRNLTRSFQFFRYEGSLNYFRDRQQKSRLNLSLGYAKSYDYPSVNQLYTIVDDINVYDIRIGNPRLRNTTNHALNFNGSFNSQKPKSAYSFNGNVGGNFRHTVNPVTDSVFNDLSGKRISYFINGDKGSTLNFYGNGNASRRFGKNSLQLTYNGSFNNSRTPNYVDGLYNVSQARSLSNELALQYSLGTVLLLNCSRNWQTYRTEQTAVRLTPFNDNRTATRFSFALNPSQGFGFSSTVEQVRNSSLASPIVLWNAFCTYRFMKQQGELKLSAMDLLKQYQNITNSVNAFGTSTTVSNGLQQFFLLTFSYYPRKFGKTEVRRQGD